MTSCGNLVGAQHRCAPAWHTALSVEAPDFSQGEQRLQALRKAKLAIAL
jgi:hypothetical protein